MPVPFLASAFIPSLGAALPGLGGAGGVGGLLGGGGAPGSSAGGGTASIGGGDVFNVGGGGGLSDAFSALTRREPFAAVALIGVLIVGVLLLVRAFRGRGGR